jgi:DNA-directed RNA polymerase specialized sigma24 family protein
LDQFRGRWYDPKRTDGGADILALACERAGYVPFPFEYGAVAHEQVIALELSSEAEPAAAYGSGIKALRYESFDFRMGFVTNTARNKARDLVKTKIKKKPEQPLEDVSGFVSGQAAAAAPARALKIDTSFVEACARVAIRSLSPQLRDQLYRHYVRGESWAIIADRYRTSPEAVRQNASRALKKIAKAIAGKIPGATDDVVSRLVEWLQDMLDRLW